MFSLLPLTYFFPLNSLKSLLLFSFLEASFVLKSFGLGWLAFHFPILDLTGTGTWPRLVS